MRVNKTTSIAVAAGLVLGGVGTATAAFAADTKPAAQSVEAPVPGLPGAEQVTKQNQLLQNTSLVLKPVTQVVQEAIKAPEGKLTKTQANKHYAAVKEALANVQEQAAVEAAPAQNSRAAVAADDRARPLAADLTAKAVVELQKQVDVLLKASVAGEKVKVTKELKNTVTATVNLVTAVVLGGGLPAPDMEGLPKLPTAPEREQQNQQEQGQQEQQGRQQEQGQQQEQSPQQEQGQQQEAPDAQNESEVVQ